MELPKEIRDLDEINRVRDLLLDALQKALGNEILAREIEAGINNLIDIKFELYIESVQKSGVGY